MKIIPQLYQPSDDSGDYLPYIDGLRALAVMAVIIFHLDHRFLPGGFSGVDVFFVISGFVISTALDKKGKSLNFSQFIVHFYARRIQRIVPALVVFLLVTSLLMVLFIPSSYLSNTNAKTGLFAFFGFSNWILVLTNNDYFSPLVEFNPFTHTWSLAVEEQFYLIFPILFFFWSFQYRTKKNYFSFYLFIFLTLLSFVFSWYLSSKDAAFNYYLLFSRFWELSAGVILFQVFTLFPNILVSVKRVWRISGSITSIIFIFIGFIAAQKEGFPFPWALFPVIGTLGVLFFLREGQSGLIQKILSQRFIVFIGKISYSLYLWHWAIIVLFRWTVGMNTIFHFIMVFGLSFLFAVLTTQFVEFPIRFSAKLRILPKSKVVLRGLLLLTVSFCVSLLFTLNQDHLSLSVTKNKTTWYPDTYPIEYQKPGCSLQTNIFPIADGSLHHIFANCGKNIQKTRIYVAGDSHAGAYLPMLQRLVLENNMEIFLYNKENCSYFNFFEPHRQNTYCLSYTKAVTDDLLKRSQSGEILFLPSLRILRFANQWALLDENEVRLSMSGPETQARRSAAVEEAIVILKSLTQKGIKIIFEAPKPIFRSPAFRCSDWFNRNNPICYPGFKMKRDELLAYRKPIMDIFQKIKAEIKEVTIWDPFPILCPDETCSSFINGKPLFFDCDHISGFANMLLFENFNIFITKQLSHSVTIK